jgi:[ribosomal protein S5]-alanine N-acetyltransferase
MYFELEPPSENSQISLFLLKPDHVTQEYVSWLNDPLVNQYLESRFVRHTIESTRDFVQSVLDSPNNLFLGIKSHISSGRHVGNIKIGTIDENHGLGEIGIMIGDKKSWGKGIGGLAIGMISKISRSRLLLRKITAGCYVSNVSSQRVFEKNGFLIEAVRKQHYLLNGKPEGVVLMGKYLK